MAVPPNESYKVGAGAGVSSLFLQEVVDTVTAKATAASDANKNVLFMMLIFSFLDNY
jgi:hypothetical protein